MKMYGIEWLRVLCDVVGLYFCGLLVFELIMLCVWWLVWMMMDWMFVGLCSVGFWMLSLWVRLISVWVWYLVECFFVYEFRMVCLGLLVVGSGMLYEVFLLLSIYVIMLFLFL